MIIEYHDGWAQLAAAIVYRGIQENDVAFLHSEWCKLLKSIYEEDYERYNDRDNSIPRPWPVSI